MKTTVSKIRKKNFIGAKDDLKLSLNSMEVLKRRYLLKNELG